MSATGGGSTPEPGPTWSDTRAVSRAHCPLVGPRGVPGPCPVSSPPAVPGACLLRGRVRRAAARRLRPVPRLCPLAEYSPDWLSVCQRDEFHGSSGKLGQRTVIPRPRLWRPTGPPAPGCRMQSGAVRPTVFEVVELGASESRFAGGCRGPTSCGTPATRSNGVALHVAGPQHPLRLNVNVHKSQWDRSFGVNLNVVLYPVPGGWQPHGLPSRRSCSAPGRSSIRAAQDCSGSQVTALTCSDVELDEIQIATSASNAARYAISLPR